MRHVFLSYRRDDTQYITGFIYQHLTAPTGFGPDSVFMDIDDIPPGVDFREVIDEYVTQCRFFLTVIGKQWATIRDADGQLRLYNSNDFVRLEVEAALRRDIPVVPLLVDGASMPKAAELPESLRPLVYKNATTIRPGKWFGPDVEELVKGLHKAEEWKKRRATTIKTTPAKPEVVKGSSAKIEPALDVWFVAAQQVYKGVPVWVATEWMEQGRVTAADKVRPTDTTGPWVAISEHPQFADYLP